MSILVACIGNIFEGDDAFGCEVAKVLHARLDSPDVQLVDFGIRGIDLTYALLEDRELTILVDAVSRGMAPGTLYTIEPELDELGEADAVGIEPHRMDTVSVLRAANQLGRPRGRVLIVGCEPGDLGGEEGRMGLTAPVVDAVNTAAEMVESLIAQQMAGARK